MSWVNPTSLAVAAEQHIKERLGITASKIRLVGGYVAVQHFNICFHVSFLRYWAIFGAQQ